MIQEIETLFEIGVDKRFMLVLYVMKLPWPKHSNVTLQSSSQAATSLPQPILEVSHSSI